MEPFVCAHFRYELHCAFCMFCGVVAVAISIDNRAELLSVATYMYLLRNIPCKTAAHIHYVV